ncbi:Asx homology domain-containing protein, partial [Amylostereum chailletii]
PEDRLCFFLQDPKSPFVRVDMPDIINAGTWAALPASSRAKLAKLLPPTAFSDHISMVEPSHPSQRWKNDEETQETCAGPSSSFRDATQTWSSDGHESHFLAAMRTWQDHLYTGWLTDAHMEKVRVFEESIRAGRTHVPWKDEVWEREHREEEEGGQVDEVVVGGGGTKGKGKGRGAYLRLSLSFKWRVDLVGCYREAREWRLQHLSKSGVIQAGDVLSYSRHFVLQGITVEKDVLVERIHSRTHALSILAPSHSSQFLPMHILVDPPITPPEDETSLRASEVTSPSQLETVILDLDGRVPRAERPHGNAWKVISVWRQREGAMDEMEVDVQGLERGGRRKLGTLFYLRGSCVRE